VGAAERDYSVRNPGASVAIQTLKRRKHSVREVPLPAALITVLDRQFRLSTTPAGSATCGSSPMAVVAHDRTAGDQESHAGAGIAGRHACPRGLRHAFGVGSLQAGVPLNLVQRWLGHARISTTAIYASACGPEELAFAARFWAVAKVRKSKARD
jgi:integrase/recombinase XerD